ncbi:MAG: hypothetical protein HY301_02435, partial [Verrucomicrobia bacterium]|nr:hypothetical protein [Verrucomicrobiota bacterium]
DEMLANAATFTTPPVTMAARATLITTYTTKLAARASRAKLDVIAFNDARAALEDALALLGNYVNGVAKGDAGKVAQSGFPSYVTGHTITNAAPAAPADLRLRPGDVSGSIVARCKPDRPNSTNEVQICTGDPNVEANWQTKGIFPGGRAELTGLTPGAVVWVRVRTVGPKGVMGNWCDPAEIRVV